MKHIRNSVLFSLLGLLSLSLDAREFADQTWQFNIGPTFNFARYNLGCLAPIQGYIAGVHTDITYSKSWGLYTGLRFDGRFNAPDLCSKGDSCEMSGGRSKVRDYIPEWDIGYTFESSCGKYFASVFSGVGFYYLSHKLEPDIIRYRYLNTYVPIGLDMNWVAKEDKIFVGLRAIYRADAYTRLKLSLPCIEVCGKLKLERSHGVLIEMPITRVHSWNDSANFQTKIVPFFDWNRFGATKETSSDCVQVPVPKLDRWYLGLRFDLGVRF